MTTLLAAAGGAAPKIVVGNAAATDPDLINEVDFLDTGNGAQLDAAIVQANADGVDIWIRPGVYDLGAVGAPSVLTTPAAGIKIRGAGRELVEIRSPDTGDQRIWDISNDRVEISDMRFLLQGGDGLGAETNLIEVTGEHCLLSRCDARVVVGPSIAATTAIRRMFAVIEGVAFQCRVGLIDSTAPGFFAAIGANLIGFYSNTRAHFNDCEVYGTDVGYEVSGSARLTDCAVTSAIVRGADIAGADQIVGGRFASAGATSVAMRVTGSDILISGVVITGGGTAANTLLLSGADRVVLAGSRIVNGGTPTISLVGSSNCVINGNVINAPGGGTTGVDFDGTSDDNILANNQISAVTPISDAGASNETAHNV
jgi:hypothetical protein